MKTLSLLVVQLAVTQPLFAGEPVWSKEVPKWSGPILFVSCHGLGPDKPLAHKQALDSCRSIAAEQIGGTFHIESLSVETEESAGFHEEVVSKADVDGLVCDPTRSFEEEIDGSYHVYLRCRFDKRQARVVPAKTMGFERKTVIKSANKSLIVSTVPRCESLIVRGNISRIVRCNSNPQTIVIRPGDRDILVRAKGYKPKSVDLADAEETLEVYLESN